MAGLDDLDLDGNWATGDEVKAAPAPKRAASAGPKKKKKRKASSLGAEGEEAAEAEAVAEEKGEEAELDPEAQRKLEKKRKKRRRGAPVKLDLEEGSSDATRACARLQAAWDAESKTQRLSPLEKKEVMPLESWFLGCSEDTVLGTLPNDIKKREKGGSLKATLSGTAPAPAEKSIAVTVLAASAERVFAAISEINSSKAWKGLKPLPLAAYGGGRKKEQVARQAKALEKGQQLAVATPGRLLRLIEEGSLDVAGLGTIVVELVCDQKFRDLLSMHDTRRDLFTLIKKHLKPELAKGDGVRFLLCGKGDAV